jgi:hypothetical protein
MLKLLALGAALFAPAAALADPITRTMTIDGPRVQGSRTVTRDRDAGTVTRDATLTRRSDGATATRHYERRRTADGFTASATATGFNGGTRSFEVTRVRPVDAGGPSAQRRRWNATHPNPRRRWNAAHPPRRPGR